MSSSKNYVLFFSGKIVAFFLHVNAVKFVLTQGVLELLVKFVLVFHVGVSFLVEIGDHFSLISHLLNQIFFNFSLLSNQSLVLKNNSRYVFHHIDFYVKLFLQTFFKVINRFQVIFNICIFLVHIVYLVLAKSVLFRPGLNEFGSFSDELVHLLVFIENLFLFFGNGSNFCFHKMV